MSRRLTTYDIVLAGRGGQGVIFLSRVMGLAALGQGLGVRTTETHGMAMRGGSVQCFVRIGDVYGPLFRMGSGDLLMVLHPAETSLARPLLSAEGSILVNDAGTETPLPAGKGQKVFLVDADGIARDCGNARSVNLALLGGAVALVKGFPLKAASIEEAIVKSGPPKAVEKNLEVFRKGLGTADDLEKI
ncbi:MAG: indolepyruvate oxidoreductase subunit beta [bacterium]|nr:indolepyruvate oxidoreductase subunit beta [bacterium]MDT8396424.1 indolepyruvate oxidoreductase subunit beta [bacterium]